LGTMLQHVHKESAEKTLALLVGRKRCRRVNKFVPSKATGLKLGVNASAGKGELKRFSANLDDRGGPFDTRQRFSENRR